MEEVVTLVISIIAGGVSGLTVNLLTEKYKADKEQQISKDIFDEKVERFIGLTNTFMDIQLSDKPQYELDLMASIRNLKRAYETEIIYQGIINQILEFEVASYDKQIRENIIAIQDRVLKMKIRIHQIEVEANYSKHLESYYSLCKKEFDRYLSEIKKLIT